MKKKIKDVFYYLEGTIRYYIYYSKFRNLIKPYIREQIELRILVMNTECYEKGYCTCCGCKTTALQMCSKACEGNCYPPFMNKEQWSHFKTFTTNTIFVFSMKSVNAIAAKKFIFKGLSKKPLFLQAKTDNYKDRLLRQGIMKTLYLEYNEQ